MNCHCKPSPRQLLDVLIDIKPFHPVDQHIVASKSQIAVITVRIHDGDRFTEAPIEGRDEVSILRNFWKLVMPNELVIHPQVTYEVEFLRQRSVALGLLAGPKS